MSAESYSFEPLFRHAPVPMYLWVYDSAAAEAVLTDYNDAAIELTAGRIAELKGKRASELYGNEPSILDDIRRCLTEEKPTFRRMKYKLRSNSAVGSFRVAFIPVSQGALVVAVVSE